MARETETRFDAGAPLPLVSHLVTQPVIDAYANASGDHNPIHVDPEFARSGPFGKTIAHGLMTLAYVSQMLNQWTDGAFDENGEIELTFISPVYAGDTVEVTGEIEEICERDGRQVAKVRLICRVGDRSILAGHAYQPINAENE
ncbi:MaoC family dehydratase [Oricola indica]|uniref:MaoC family dehydratase n=1 Tax=Oricola indica TaxID=2872591 RepID=UPI001CBA8B90|nr:MaoC family dehydratase [Oricola indica]